MPNIDVTDLLSDPDFATFDLVCQRTLQVVDEGGIAGGKTTNIDFVGVVTADEGDVLKRIALGQQVSGSIVICTTFQLSVRSDVIVFNGRQYTVVGIDDYTEFGEGFVQAYCDLLPFDGVAGP